MTLDLKGLIERYQRDGYLLFEKFIPQDLVNELQSQTKAFVEAVRGGTLDGALLDVFEDERGDKRLRRIEHPEQVHEIYDRVMRFDPLLDIVQELLGGTVRFDHGKLNLKPPAGRAAVEWHQDWAFLPHTNDDMLAVGIMIEDCTTERGPLMVVPGSHRGKVYNHHQDGKFVGGIDGTDLVDVLPNAVPLTGPAGSVSIHHTRMLHGSVANLGATDRPLLLYNYFAVDAFPVFHRFDWEEFNSRILRGEPVFTPRLKEVPMRVPEPTPKPDDGQTTLSLYELQLRMRGAINS